MGLKPLVKFELSFRMIARKTHVLILGQPPRLNNCRCRKNREWNVNPDSCERICNYHSTNNTEIHYKGLGKNRVGTDIAIDWIKDLIVNYPRSGIRPYYLSIIGLNYSKLNLEQFGEDKGTKLKIYNRFYRTILKGGFQYFFQNYPKINVKNIFHDSGSQEEHEFFPWHSIYKINQEMNNISFDKEKIEFIDSDHRKSKKIESHLIQFTDLLLGATLVCLHNSSTKAEKIKIGLAFKPVLQILMNREPVDRSYKPYYGSRYERCISISFFPKRCDCQSLLNFDSDEVRIKNSEFYYNRDICLPDPTIKTLDQWF